MRGKAGLKVALHKPMLIKVILIDHEQGLRPLNLCLAASLLLLAGCVHYAPKPVVPAETLNGLETRSLTNEGLRVCTQRKPPFFNMSGIVEGHPELSPVLPDFIRRALKDAHEATQRVARQPSHQNG